MANLRMVTGSTGKEISGGQLSYFLWNTLVAIDSACIALGWMIRRIGLNIVAYWRIQSMRCLLKVRDRGRESEPSADMERERGFLCSRKNTE